MNEQLSNNEVGFATDLNDIDGKYYLNSNKPNDNIRQSRRDSTEKELKVLSSASESIAGQSPTLTDSQRIKLNNILHTGKLTNCNISTFSDYEFADSSFVEDVLDSPVIEKGCCYLI